MNQKCKVCGEPAAGFHFGAFTCEGCKSFFGRTYSNVSAIGECKNGGQCVINKKNRTSCKACRLRKCLLVGMSKSGSRYGRRSNWFKIHCLLQEQTGLETPLGSNPLSSNGYTMNMNTLSPGTNETSRTTPDAVCTNDVHSSPSSSSSSSSSVTSSRDSTNGDDDTSKENLRLLLTSSPNMTSDSNYLKRNALPKCSPRRDDLLPGKSVMKNTTKTGLLAIGTPFNMLKNSDHSSPSPHPILSPKLNDSSSSCCSSSNNSSHLHNKVKDGPSLVGPFAATSHPFYEFIAIGHHHRIFISPQSDKEEELMEQDLHEPPVPEQEGPIDLSCKTQPVCHIRAEILADIHLLKENDASPLDLTTKG